MGDKQEITPNLDRIAREILVFENLYATGTRTVRGIEALTLAFRRRRASRSSTARTRSVTTFSDVFEDAATIAPSSTAATGTSTT